MPDLALEVDQLFSLGPTAPASPINHASIQTQRIHALKAQSINQAITQLAESTPSCSPLLKPHYQSDQLMSPPLEQPKCLLYRSIQLFFCVLGIYITFLSYAVLQERIYAKKYYTYEQSIRLRTDPSIEPTESFEHAWFLVWMQVTGNFLFALIMITIGPAFLNQSVNQSIDQSINQSVFAISIPRSVLIRLSFSYIAAMIFSNWALSYISYPLQSLAKSCKLIPVMLGRILLVKARYSAREYCQVALITIGITVFMMSKQSTHQSNNQSNNQSMPINQDDPIYMMFGVCLCLIALVLDGFTGPEQERCYNQYSCSSSSMMLYLNLYASILVLGMLIAINQLLTGVRFVQANPDFLIEASMFGFCAATGQCIILLTLRLFDSLVLVTITTTRKFCTILLSVALYGHRLTFSQWVGVMLVFGGLCIDIYGAADKQRKLRMKSKVQEEDDQLIDQSINLLNPRSDESLSLMTLQDDKEDADRSKSDLDRVIAAIAANVQEKESVE